MPDECIEYLRGLFGSSYMQLDREEQLILGTAYLEGSVTNVRMQTMLKRNGVEVGHILARLVDKGMLIADKRGRWTSYEINREYENHGEQQCLGDANQLNLFEEHDRSHDGSYDGSHDRNREDKNEMLLEFCSIPRTRSEIQDFLNMSSVGTFRRRYLTVLLEDGRLKMTMPEKPKSRYQKYIKA